jgi:hypothetical protein
MNTYVILRREGWPTAADLQRAGERQAAVGEEMPDDVVSHAVSPVVPRQSGGGHGEPPPNAGHEGGIAPLRLKTPATPIPFPSPWSVG